MFFESTELFNSWTFHVINADFEGEKNSLCDIMQHFTVVRCPRNQLILILGKAVFVPIMAQSCFYLNQLELC